MGAIQSIMVQSALANTNFVWNPLFNKEIYVPVMEKDLGISFNLPELALA